MYRVQGFSCPVLTYGQEDEGPTADDPRRCGAAVFLHVVAEVPAWRADVFAECMEGHGDEEFAMSVTRDLDGVPIGV